MSTEDRRIIVLTPVKDEAWILPKFLYACSRFADSILVLDQQSTDGSREICARFPKVTVIENPSADYNEAQRSKLLVAEARRRFGPGNILLGLDADEIVVFEALDSPGWAALRRLSPGTVLCFEKPEVLPSPRRVLRAAYRFPLGLVDDGAEHTGRLIHGQRVPFRQEAPRFVPDDLIVLHLARLRWTEYCVRQAMYCMVENVNRTKSHRVRNCYYSPYFFTRLGETGAEALPESWWRGYREAGLDLWSFTSDRFNSFHVRALRLMAQHGVRRFWGDDIWWEDWEQARQALRARGYEGLPDQPIAQPPGWRRGLTACLLRIYAAISQTAGFLRRQIFGRNRVNCDL